MRGTFTGDGFTLVQLLTTKIAQSSFGDGLRGHLPT